MSKAPMIQLKVGKNPLFYIVATLLLVILIGFAASIKRDHYYFTQVESGGSHACAIASNHQAYCWGDGQYGQLGVGSTFTTFRPVRVSQGQLPPSAYFTQISTGSKHTCALASDNKIYCWGQNFYGQLGDNSFSNKGTPVQVDHGALPHHVHFTYISAGEHHNCALASDDKVYCWGGGNSGQLGNNRSGGDYDNHIKFPTPIQVHQGELPNDAHFIQITAGASHTCALASDSKAYCWGDDYSYYYSNNELRDRRFLTPTQVRQGDLPTTAHFTQIVANGSVHTCALASDSKAYCWGRNDYGELGNNASGYNRTMVYPTEPTRVHQGELPNDAHFIQITAGGSHTCALASNNKTYCWGWQEYDGSFGDGAAFNSLKPFRVY